MQVKDVLDKLAEMFPRHAFVLNARLDVYKTTLTPIAGDRLTQAYERTMRSWSKEAPPWPKEIADNAPDRVAGDDRVERTERAIAIQHQLITDTFNWLALEIAAVAKDNKVTVGDIEGTLKTRWERHAWDIACHHVKTGRPLPVTLPMKHDDLVDAAVGVLRAQEFYRNGGRYAGSFKHLRAPAVEPSPATEGHELADSRTVTAETVQE